MAMETPRRTAAQLPYYLEDILFPCSRVDILHCAEENEAPDALLDAIERLPEGSYWSVQEIVARVSGSTERHTSLGGASAAL